MKAYAAIAGIAYFALLIATFIGWTMNALILARVILDGGYMSDHEFLLRAVGIAVAPLGAIVGWF